MSNYQAPKRKTRWVGLVLFAVLVLGSLASPFYIWRFGLSPVETALFLFYYFATSLSITVGYHRHFAHQTFKTNRVIRFLLLFFGAASYEQSAIKWASQHRQHHQFTDTELDPHNSKKGFWYCHIGWIIFYKHVFNRENVRDLINVPLIKHQHEFYNLWAFVSGALIPMLVGFYIERPLGVFLVSICLRMFLVMNTAFLINSYAHMIGQPNYNKNESARDHWLGGIITHGEGYHSFHHKFPNDYRNGHLWHHFDLSKWIIFGLSKLGLAWELKRTPDYLLADFKKK